MSGIFRSVFAAIALMLIAQPTPAQEHDCSDDQARQNKRFTTSDVNLREWSSTYADVLATLPKGEIVYAYREADGWSQVNVASLNITGYVSSRYLNEACVAGGGISREKLPRANVITILMATSQANYSGSCPCPENRDRAGRRCGARSAYSRPGGRSPLCYPSDVTEAMINQFRSSR